MTNQILIDMKNLLLLSIITLAALYVSGQTYTSANNGNWTDPNTWNPIGVPVTFSEVIINHNVILNTDFSYSSGQITINSGGSLTEDVAPRYLSINGGSLSNSGTFTIYGFALYSGDFLNYGTSNIDQLYTNGNLNNFGLIDQVDSLLNDFNIDNDGGIINAVRLQNNYYIMNSGNISGTDFLNASYLDNDSTIIFTNFLNTDSAFNWGEIYFDDHTNAGYFENYGDMIGSSDFTNSGWFENYEYFSVDNDFSNIDSSLHDAMFYTEGLVVVGNNWFNADTIDGTSTGQFCITNNTGNSGEMYGNFDFCDQTPPGSSPYIDYNTGYIDPNIVYCQTSCGTDININSNNNIFVYPNPVKDKLFIENMNKTVFVLYDVTGKVVLQRKINSNNTSINISTLNKGTYLFNILSDSVIIKSNKLIIE